VSYNFQEFCFETQKYDVAKGESLSFLLERFNKFAGIQRRQTSPFANRQAKLSRTFTVTRQSDGQTTTPATIDTKE